MYILSEVNLTVQSKMPISGDYPRSGADADSPSRSRTTSGQYIELPYRPAGHVIKGAAQCPTCFSVWQLGCKIFSAAYSPDSPHMLFLCPNRVPPKQAHKTTEPCIYLYRYSLKLK